MRPRRRLTLLQAFGLAAGMTGAAVLLCGWAISQLEPARFQDVGDGIWWAITTITTVGYGDYVPTSASGRAVGAGLMFVGFASLAFVTATMASVIVGEVRAEEQLLVREETEVLRLLAELSERLERLERAVAAGSAGVSREGAGTGPGVRAGPR